MPQEITTKILVENEYQFDNDYRKMVKRFAKSDINLNLSKRSTIYYHPEFGDLSAIQVTITYDQPKIYFHDFLYTATLKKSVDNEDGTQVFAIDSKEDFSRYFDNSFRCDHCKTNRRRLKVHIFRHKNDPKKELMIATTCAKEYFGEYTVTAIRKVFQSIKSLINFEDKIKEYFEADMRTIVRFPIKRFAKIAYGIIRIDGKYRKNDEYSMDESTAKSANRILNGNIYVQSWKEEMKIINEKSVDFDFDSILKYWDDKAQKDKSNFVNNVKVAFRQLNPQIGFIAYGVYEYLKNQKDLFGVKSLPKFKNGYLGELGQPLKATATVEKIVVREGSGFSYYQSNSVYEIVNLRTTTGHKLTWFTSNSKLEEKMKIRITGKVKKHNEYNGFKSTMVTRCKWEKI